jgi:hypothetical protein
LCQKYVFKQSVTGLEWSTGFQEVKVKVKQSVTGLEWPTEFQKFKVKVKQSRYRPGVANRVSGS